VHRLFYRLAAVAALVEHSTGEIVKNTGFVSAAKVLLCAIAAILVLSTWFIDPVVSGKIGEVGPFLYWLPMISVIVAVVCVLVVELNSDKSS
jgi:hypothetical protein